MKFLDNKIFYPLAAVLFIAMIAISLIWPQGLGTRSPGVFGHAIEYPDYYRMDRERTARRNREAAEKAQRRANAAADAAASVQTSAPPAP